MAGTESTAAQIPDKAYFRIGEVSRLVGVDTHVLRYWEAEFSGIRPFRGKSKQRLYRRQDVDNLLQVKRLLHDEGYTIAGARKVLAELKVGSIPAPKTATTRGDTGGRGTFPEQDLIEGIRRELLAMQLLLTRKPTP